MPPGSTVTRRSFQQRWPDSVTSIIFAESRAGIFACTTFQEIDFSRTVEVVAVDIDGGSAGNRARDRTWRIQR